MALRAVLKTELSDLAGGRADQAELTGSCKAMQLPPGKNNRTDHLALTGSELPQVLISTCPVDRKNQIQLIS
jgi:hypothetical protein